MLNSLLAASNPAIYGIITDVVCAIILIIFVAVGAKKGFVKQVFGIITTVGAFLVAYFLCSSFVNILNSWWGLTDKLSGSLFKAFSSIPGIGEPLSPETITNIVAQMKLPDFVAQFAINNLPNITDSALSVGQYLSDILASYIMIAICFVVLFIVAKLLLLLLKKLFEKLVKLPVLRGINTVLGLVIGLLKGALIVYGIVFLLSLLPTSVGFFDAINTALNNSYVAKFMLQYNLFAAISNWVVALVNGIFN